MSVTTIVELAEDGAISQYAPGSLMSDLLSACMLIVERTVLDSAGCRLILTGDFDDSVRARLAPEHAGLYASDRGSGAVAGKTMFADGYLDILMPVGLFANHAGAAHNSYQGQLIRRTVEHESLHVRLKQAGESSLEPLHATHSPSVFLREAGRNIIEEFRVESAIDPTAYPLLAPASTDGALKHWAERLAIVALDEYPHHESVNRLWVGVFSVCQATWTRLGYVAAAQTWKAATSPAGPDPQEQGLWDEMVAPCWTDFMSVLRSTGSARSRLQDQNMERAGVRMSRLLADWFPVLGFEFIAGAAGEEFYIVAPDLLHSRLTSLRA